MSGESFTQGEWRVEGDAEVWCGNNKICDTTDDMIVYVTFHKDDGTVSEKVYGCGQPMGNANLISAAPDMYRALKQFVSNSSCQTGFPSACEEAEKALARADGEDYD